MFMVRQFRSRRYRRGAPFTSWTDRGSSSMQRWCQRFNRVDRHSRIPSSGRTSVNRVRLCPQRRLRPAANLAARQREARRPRLQNWQSRDLPWCERVRPPGTAVLVLTLLDLC